MFIAGIKPNPNFSQRKKSIEDYMELYGTFHAFVTSALLVQCVNAFTYFKLIGYAPSSLLQKNGIIY